MQPSELSKRPCNIRISCQDNGEINSGMYKEFNDGMKEERSCKFGMVLMEETDE